jgi:membrane protein implicated in regulation of membrane protease activity
VLAFWSGYADNPLLTSMYSLFVLLVLMLVTIAGLYDGADDVMGWVGVAALALLVLLVLAFKAFIIDYLVNSVKALVSVNLYRLKVIKQLRSSIVIKN